MSTAQIRDLPAATSLDGSELVELQKAAGGAGSSEQTPNGALLPPGYIDGLKMQWVSANAVTVGSGSAYIPSLGRVVRAPTALALSSLVLTASTWYHLYLYLNAGTPAIECVTTAPAAAYYGTARAKTGDTSRRYIGSVRTDGTGNVIRFDHCSISGNIMYGMSINNAPLNPLVNGGATTATNVDLSGSIPVTGSRGALYLENSAASSVAYIATPDLGDPIVNVITFVRSGVKLASSYLLSSNQQINYECNSAPAGGTGLTVWVLGYTYER